MQRTLASASLVAAMVVGVTFPYAANAQQAQLAQAGEDVAQGMSRERWDESLTWMVERHKMPDVQGEDRKKILDYLATAFPERKEPGGWKNPFTGK